MNSAIYSDTYKIKCPYFYWVQTTVGMTTVNACDARSDVSASYNKPQVLTRN